jgi:hypothetical protein
VRQLLRDQRDESEAANFNDESSLVLRVDEPLERLHRWPREQFFELPVKFAPQDLFLHGATVGLQRTLV